MLTPGDERVPSDADVAEELYARGARCVREGRPFTARAEAVEEVLRAEAHGKTDHTRTGEQRADLDPALGQHQHDCRAGRK